MGETISDLYGFFPLDPIPGVSYILKGSIFGLSTTLNRFYTPQYSERLTAILTSPPVRTLSPVQSGRLRLGTPTLVILRNDLKIFVDFLSPVFLSVPKNISLEGQRSVPPVLPTPSRLHRTTEYSQVRKI